MPTMNGYFAARRFRNTGILLVVVSATLALSWAYSAMLYALPYATGWALFALVLFLTFFNLRKRMPYLPLLRVSTWMQMHAYAGAFTFLVFFLHTGWSLPNGRFETMLWTMFVVVGASGVIGLGINRIIPIRQKQYGEPIFRDRLSVFRGQLANEVEELIISSMYDSQTRTLARFYTGRLRHFFAAPRNVLEHLMGQRISIDKLMRELESADRYLDTDGKEVMARIREKVVQKDGLDFQYAHYLMLRAWLFIHIPATYSLLVLVVVHLSLTYGYGMGTP